MNHIHNRKSIRLKDYDYSCPGEYFVTICTKNRACLFGEIVNEKMNLSKTGIIVDKHWKNILSYKDNVELDEYIIMPNHIHGIVVIKEPVRAILESPVPTTKYRRRKMLLSKIIGRFKTMSAKEVNILRNTLGIPLWHRNYYEHIIRGENDLANIREYIANNVFRWAHKTKFE